MGTPTYEQIATKTLTAATGTITFSSISQEYSDLILITEIGAASDYAQLFIRFNSDSGSNYIYTNMSSLSWNTNYSQTNTSSAVPLFTSGISTTERMATRTQIFDYSKTDKNKNMFIRNDYYGPSQNAVEGWAARWGSNSAITSISLISGAVGAYNTNFSIGSTFTLYGIRA